MTRHFQNAASVQAQLDEIRELQEKLDILVGEMRSFMDTNDIDRLNGETTCYDRVWVNDTLIFDSTKFKADNPNLYEQYKTKEKAGCYRYSVKAIK
jgi:hypothetical protein